jgi:transposase
MAGRMTATPVRMTAKRHRKLRQIVAAGTSAQRLVLRARIVLEAAAGVGNAEISRLLRVSENTVRTWRDRFARRGIPGLFDAPRPGRPELHGPSVRLAVVSLATSTPPDGESVWSHTLIAAHLAGHGRPISPATVGRILADADVRPHKVRGWLNRRDDDTFWIRAAAVCRLYLNPPPGTVLISIDEKTGIQARSRKHPEVGVRPGRDARREFEYIRHGTVSIIAAMNVATGQVIAERIEANNSATFTKFLHRLGQLIDPALNIHLIMDNGSSHVSKATRAWIAARPRFTVTYTPVHASWLNMIEQWFGVLTRRLLRRGAFTSRDELQAQITTFTVTYNKTARPYRWSYNADADHASYLARHPQPADGTDTDLENVA